MGTYNVMDMISRLPITEDDDVIAFCIPISDWDGFLHWRTGFFNDCVPIRMVKGKYGGYGDVVGDKTRLFERDNGEKALFMKKTTADFIEKAYDKRDRWDEENEKKTLSVFMRSCENSFVTEMFKKYGWRAVDWAFEREYNKFKEYADDSVKAIVKDWFDYKRAVEKNAIPVESEGDFENHAELHSLLFEKTEWFCRRNRISPFLFNFESYTGQGIQETDFEMAMNFAKFIQSECEAKIEQYEKEMGDEY